MDTGILNPKELFQKNVTYTVPAFQRRYVWSQEEQWEPLWEDVQNIAEDYLEKLEANDGDEVKAEENTRRHFLGAVVIQQVSTPTKDIERREVIDGQQRLTTLQLLLDAIQYVLETHRLDRVAKRLSKLVVNDVDLIANEDQAFKLWPTIGDREAFRHAMHNELIPDDHRSNRIVQAHEFFQLHARQWLEVDGALDSNRADALEAAVSSMLRMVVIDLDVHDNPHVIFETLNARGTPLLESDLIKNFVMSNASKDVGEAIWGHLDDEWWREDIRQGRLFRPRIDMLLDYWLEMQTFDDVLVGRLFTEFQKIAADRRIEDVMSILREDLGRYRSYEEGPRSQIEDAMHYRAGVIQTGAFTPVLLLLLSRPKRARLDALKILESYLVRRMICRETTKDYNRLALELAKALYDNEPNNVASVMRVFFQNQTADSRSWPTDKDLRNALMSLPLYRLLTRGRLRLILEAIEAYLRDEPETEQADVPKNLTIEHVLPVNWQTHWPLESSNDDERIHRRNVLLHTIGNLTLIKGRLNSMVSNGPWQVKRDALNKHSVLMLNKFLIEESANAVWDEQFITDRSDRIAKIVARVWPRPG